MMNSEKGIRIIGIDPGVATTGWAIVDFVREKISLVDYGVISTLKIYSISERLIEINNDLEELLNKYKPEAAGVESLIFCNNAKTAISVGEARGVVLLNLQKKLIPIYECTPLQLKDTITGYGKADKKQVQRNIMRLCNLDEVPKPDDAADAIGIAIWANGQVGVGNLGN